MQLFAKSFIDKRTRKTNIIPKRDILYDEIKSKVSDECKPEIMDAEDPLFILYTLDPRCQKEIHIVLVTWYMPHIHSKHFST